MENNNRNFVIGLVVLALVIGAFIFVGFNRDKIKSDNNNQVVAEVDNQEYFDENAKVMFFFSEGCGWCTKEKKEVLLPLGKEGYRVKPIDAAKDRDSFVKYNVSGTPTFITPDGKRYEGFQTYDELKKILDENK